jgi:cytochrome d ubiquinol oxidase subunit II
MDAMLPTIWAGILAFAILVYVVLDGFDLGIGVLFGTTGNETYRRQMMASVAPVWDGNETWLLVVGAGLFGAFPIVYAIFLSALYLPVILLLIALIFRGVAFEFRYKSESMRWLWDWGFFLGSAVATFVQGAAIGAMVNELPVEDGRFVGSAFFWLTPFAVCCGIGLILGFCLLGATWLILKTEGELRAWAYRRAPWLLGAVLAFLVVVFAYALVLQLDVMQRWIERPVLWIFPAIGAAATAGCVLGIRARSDGGELLALHGAVLADDRAGGVTALVAALPVLRRRFDRDTRDPDLHDHGLLGVPGQDRRGGALRLSRGAHASAYRYGPKCGRRTPRRCAKLALSPLGGRSPCRPTSR